MLLGMTWKGQLYIDGPLPFGLRSAPKLFTAVADTLRWVMGQHRVRIGLHYHDHYLICGPPNSSACRVALDTSLDLRKKLGFLTASQKVDGPATCISYLGILIDTEAGVLRFPPDKLQHLQATISSWESRKSCRKREMLSLIVQLSHACRVI